MSFIDIQNLTFSYKNKKSKNQVINIPKLTLEKGQSLFLYGPSGHGKSTLLNIIAGVLSPTSGEILIDGENVSALSSSKKDLWRGDHLGYVFQNFNLISYLNILENIMLPTKFSKHRNANASTNRAMELIERMNLKEYLHHKVNDLSIGQQQRVALCRALIGDPKLLLADEPTSSLDEKNTQELMNILKEEKERTGLTMIFVSHDLRLKPYFDREVSLSEINVARRNVEKGVAHV